MSKTQAYHRRNCCFIENKDIQKYIRKELKENEKANHDWAGWSLCSNKSRIGLFWGWGGPNSLRSVTVLQMQPRSMVRKGGLGRGCGHPQQTRLPRQTKGLREGDEPARGGRGVGWGVRVAALCSLPGWWAPKASLSSDKATEPRQDREGSGPRLATLERRSGRNE